jgi:hypothetical protein
VVESAEPESQQQTESRQAESQSLCGQGDQNPSTTKVIQLTAWSLAPISNSVGADNQAVCRLLAATTTTITTTTTYYYYHGVLASTENSWSLLECAQWSLFLRGSRQTLHLLGFRRRRRRKCYESLVKTINSTDLLVKQRVF